MQPEFPFDAPKATIVFDVPQATELRDQKPKNLDFNLQEAKRLAQDGMNRAEIHANKVVDDWSEKAFRLLLEYIPTVDNFICEDYRAYCVGRLEEIKENRAFGSVIRRAVIGNFIKHTGTYREMKDKKSHGNPKKVWEKVTSS